MNNQNNFMIVQGENLDETSFSENLSIIRWPMCWWTRTISRASACP